MAIEREGENIVCDYLGVRFIVRALGDLRICIAHTNQWLIEKKMVALMMELPFCIHFTPIHVVLVATMPSVNKQQLCW